MDGMEYRMESTACRGSTLPHTHRRSRGANETHKQAGIAFRLGLIAFLLLVTIAPKLSAQAPDGPEPLPDGFGGIRLGMEIDVVKELLLESPHFRFRGDPDVTLLPRPAETVIETEGGTYVRRGIFQFHERRLHTIILILAPNEIDWFSMYTTLKGKYGDQSRLSPEEIVWENDSVRLSLERPLSVKYVHVPVWERLKEAGRARRSLNEIARDRFLEEF